MIDKSNYNKIDIPKNLSSVIDESIEYGLNTKIKPHIDNSGKTVLEARINLEISKRISEERIGLVPITQVNKEMKK